MQVSVIKFLSAFPSARIFLVSLLLAGTSLVAIAQGTNPKPVQEPSPNVSAPRPTSGAATNVDETFELNIVERRYSQDHFEAATAVATNSEDQKLRLQVGVALVSGRIDVLLRNVHGAVRFRGTLDRILQIIKDRQAPADTQPPTPAPPPDNE
jgi:hypothetical protein